MATKLKFYQTIIFTVLFVGYGIYSYNRKSVTYTVPRLVEEGISKENAGTIASAQNLAYMIGKIFCGVLSVSFCIIKVLIHEWNELIFVILRIKLVQIYCSQLVFSCLAFSHCSSVIRAISICSYCFGFWTD